MPTKPAARTKKLGPKEIRFSVDPDTPFEEIVSTMERALTLPEIGRFKGCAPCMSGLERFVLEDPAMSRFQQRG
jgi:hypothetical protein